MHCRLTSTDGLQDFLRHLHLMVVPDADAAVDLVEQSWAQVGKLAGGDRRMGVQAIIVE